MSGEPKLCRDCKYSGPAPITIDSLCRHERATFRDHWDLVGAVEPKRALCAQMRNDRDHGACGSVGRLFEPRDAGQE